VIEDKSASASKDEVFVPASTDPIYSAIVRRYCDQLTESSTSTGGKREGEGFSWSVGVAQDVEGRTIDVMLMLKGSWWR
jgi:hypothetical protein